MKGYGVVGGVGIHHLAAPKTGPVRPFPVLVQPIWSGLPVSSVPPPAPVHSCLGARFTSLPGCCHGEPAPGAQERLSQTSPRSVSWSHLPISQLRSPSPAQRSLLSRQPHSRWQVHHRPGGRAGAAVPGDGETGKRQAARSDTSNSYMKSSRDAATPSLGQKKQKSPLSAYAIPQDWLPADSMLCRVI